MNLSRKIKHETPQNASRRQVSREDQEDVLEMRIHIVCFLFAAASLYGCGPAIQVGPKNLDFAQPKIVNACTFAAVPPPLAETVTIRITPGEKVHADAGGEVLLKQYMALRKAIRDGRLKRCSR